MVISPLNRRAFITAFGACAAYPHVALSDDYIDLDWQDLLPLGETSLPRELAELTDHSNTNPSSQQPISSGVRTEWNGQVVRIPGFMVPLEYSGTGVSAFILVPFVGACVHVPPPPSNQLVFVTTQKPYESNGLYEPINVIGMFGTAPVSTQLADISYALSADEIVPYAG